MSIFDSKKGLKEMLLSDISKKTLAKDGHWVSEEQDQSLQQQLWKPCQERSKEWASPRLTLGQKATSVQEPAKEVIDAALPRWSSEPESPFLNN